MASVKLDIGCANCAYPVATLQIGDGDVTLAAGDTVEIAATCDKCKNTVKFGKVPVS